jgi:hypothetical protein
VIATDNGMRPPGPRLVPVSDAGALVEAVFAELTEPKPREMRRDQAGHENLEAVLNLYKELAP